MLDLPAGSGESAVALLHARLVEAAPGIVDAAGFLADVIARMRLAPVCIADDVAMPHARTNAVSRMVVGVGRSDAPLTFDAGHTRVRLVFLIGTPKAAVTDYLQTVAALSRLLRNKTTRAGLLAATDETEFRALLSGSVAASQ